MALVNDLKKCNGIYQIIYPDPPWSYRERVQHGGSDKGYTSHAGSFYTQLTVEQLCDMAPVIKNITDPKESLCYMWTAAPILEDSLRVMEAWGYDYKTIAFVWEKVMVNPGAYTMSSCEYVIVGKRGRIPKPRGARNVRQFIQEKRTTHSAKPLEVRERITQMHPLQRKLELFSRFDQKNATDPLWDDWGQDLGSVPWIPKPK